MRCKSLVKNVCSFIVYSTKPRIWGLFRWGVRPQQELCEGGGDEETEGTNWPGALRQCHQTGYTSPDEFQSGALSLVQIVEILGSDWWSILYLSLCLYGIERAGITNNSDHSGILQFPHLLESERLTQFYPTYYKSL